jgi:AraC-like DNA-binding protein
MVCSRCKMVVRDELLKFGLHPTTVELGEITITEEIDEYKKDQLNKVLMSFGFELIDDKKSRIVERIKNTIVEIVHYSEEQLKTNFSIFISEKLHQDYNYLSNLFSEMEGITIEKYFINQKIEKVKELLVYDELTLSEISDRMNYSSVSHLGKQFKKVTGMTPSAFRQLKTKIRIPLEDL